MKDNQFLAERQIRK